MRVMEFCLCRPILFISDTIAFTAALTSYLRIPEESAVEFNEVLLNEGDG